MTLPFVFKDRVKSWSIALPDNSIDVSRVQLTFTPNGIHTYFISIFKGLGDEKLKDF